MSEKFLNIIELMKKKQRLTIGIFAHQNADPDTVVSAIGLKFLLKEFFPNAEYLLFASSISVLSKNVLASSKEVFLTEAESTKFDAIFICDANNFQQLGNISLDNNLTEDTLVFIIDHHEKIDSNERITVAIVKKATSTAEIIGMIYKNMKIQIKPEVATLLLSGIIFDTRRFIYLSNSTFEIVQYLIGEGGDYNFALQSLQRKPSDSERIARIKGATRLILHRKGSDIYIISHISSYESSVARAMIDLGASCTIVLADPSVNNYRISMRCTNEFANKNNVSLGIIADKIATKLGGSGGGHQTAAGINLQEPKDFPKEKEKMIELLLELFLEEMREE